MQSIIEINSMPHEVSKNSITKDYLSQLTDGMQLICEFLELEDRVMFSLTSKQLRQKDKKFIQLSLRMNQMNPQMEFLNQLESEIACGMRIFCCNKSARWLALTLFLALITVSLWVGELPAFSDTPNYDLGLELLPLTAVATVLLCLSWRQLKKVRIREDRLAKDPFGAAISNGTATQNQCVRKFNQYITSLEPRITTMREERLTPINPDTTSFNTFTRRIRQERDCLSFFVKKSKQPVSTDELNLHIKEQFLAILKRDRTKLELERQRYSRENNPAETSIEVKSEYEFAYG